jgi:predicted ATPase
VREAPGQPLLQTLVESLRPRQMLLVLDNCEHLVGACAHLAQGLLQSCPHLRVLATSREALGIAGETRYRVPSLSLPAAERLPVLEHLGQYEAVRLFLERAAAVLPGFRLTAANAAGVAEVCRRLDGIPLAIELAAARMNALPVEELAARLEDRFRLLRSGSRTALPRHQTLRSLIDWSYDLLTEPERTLLRRLSVFAGGWTSEAAEAVCVGERVEEWEVLDLLTSLVEKSLVLYEERSGEGRYRLLETVRQYARDRLLEAAEANPIREQHLHYSVSWAEKAAAQMQETEEARWVERFEEEHDNLRAALGWSGVQGERQAGLRLGGAQGRFWEVLGYWREGREQLAVLLELPGAEARTAARAKALNWAGRLAVRQGDFGAPGALFEESLAISRELGSKWDIAHSLGGLGWTAYGQGDYGAARALFEESLTIFREIGDKPGIADTLARLGLNASSRIMRQP